MTLRQAAEEAIARGDGRAGLPRQDSTAASSAMVVREPHGGRVSDCGRASIPEKVSTVLLGAAGAPNRKINQRADAVGFAGNE